MQGRTAQAISRRRPRASRAQRQSGHQEAESHHREAGDLEAGAGETPCRLAAAGPVLGQLIDGPGVPVWRGLRGLLVGRLLLAARSGRRRLRLGWLDRGRSCGRGRGRGLRHRSCDAAGGAGVGGSGRRGHEQQCGQGGKSQERTRWKSCCRAVRCSLASSFLLHTTLRGLCWPGFAKYSRPANARVGRGGGRHRHTSGPAPAAAPASGGVGAVMAGPRRARARRSPHSGARRGHLRPPDVGVLRAFRHAGR